MIYVLKHEPIRIIIEDEIATRRVARSLATSTRPNDIIALWGGLGVGKTYFARNFINGLTLHIQEVPSPTFTLVQQYDTPTGVIYHFDMYRLNQPDHAMELGIEDAFSEGICLIEWPERLGTLLPTNRLDILISEGKTCTSRIIEMGSNNDDWNQRLTNITW